MTEFKTEAELENEKLELSMDELNGVAGGGTLNPQPLPPERVPTPVRGNGISYF